MLKKKLNKKSSNESHETHIKSDSELKKHSENSLWYTHNFNRLLTENYHQIGKYCLVFNNSISFLDTNDINIAFKKIEEKYSCIKHPNLYKFGSHLERPKSEKLACLEIDFCLNFIWFFQNQKQLLGKLN